MKLHFLPILFLFLFLAACSPIIIVGNTVGRVIDKETREPIIGAELECEWWAYHYAIVDSSSSTIAEYKTKTDKDGKYVIPRLWGWGGLTGHHGGTQCYVSKENYATYELYFSYRPHESAREKENNITIELEKAESK